MRGTRFRRPATKKQSSKEKRGERQTSTFYEEPTPIDPSQVSSKTANALEHLGNQRFALPPFSEHFQRWMMDVRSVLTEFESELPDAADQSYYASVEKILSSTQNGLDKHVDAEKGISEETSKLQQELTACEIEISKLQREYKAGAHDVRRGYERSAEKLRGDIDSLDKKRSKLLRKGPNLLEKILRRPEKGLEASASALQVKRIALGNKKETLQRDLEDLRTTHISNSKQMTERSEALRAKLAEFKRNTLDDALEVRKQASQELCQVMAEAVKRLSGQQPPPSVENIQ